MGDLQHLDEDPGHGLRRAGAIGQPPCQDVGVLLPPESLQLLLRLGSKQDRAGGVQDRQIYLDAVGPGSQDDSGNLLGGC